MVEDKFKEKWYLNNITIGLVLFICSMVPFASILGIPLVVLKSYKYKNYIKNINEQSSKEIHRLKELISPDAKKIEELKKSFQEIKDEIKNLNNIKDIKTKELKKVEEKATKELKNNISKLKEERSFLQKDISNLNFRKLEKEKAIEELNNEIIELRDEVLLQSFSLYKPQYDFINSAQYKYKLDDVREEQKNMIRKDKAVLGATNWTVNNDARKGKKIVNVNML